MPETFLILLAGGIMLAAAVSDPKAVTLQWLRLAGILALTMGGLAVFFYLFAREIEVQTPPFFTRVQAGLGVATIVAVLGQLAFVQVAWRRTQRALAGAAFVLAVLAGTNLLHEMMLDPAGAVAGQVQAAGAPKVVAMGLQTAGCAGIAAMTGLALMAMLLGHAYLTASRMAMKPFARLNGILAGVVIARGVMAVGLVLMTQARWPVEMLWGVQGLFIFTRWFVGLLVPGIFVYMAHDCIKRRATQSATGILYVTGVLILIGEIVALYLIRETGLPF